jgi:hypothetical protein
MLLRRVVGTNVQQICIGIFRVGPIRQESLVQPSQSALAKEEEYCNNRDIKP